MLDQLRGDGCQTCSCNGAHVVVAVGQLVKEVHKTQVVEINVNITMGLPGNCHFNHTFQNLLAIHGIVKKVWSHGYLILNPTRLAWRTCQANSAALLPVAPFAALPFPLPLLFSFDATVARDVPWVAKKKGRVPPFEVR